MLTAAAKALSQMFSPPFRAVLLKSAGFALVILIVLVPATDTLTASGQSAGVVARAAFAERTSLTVSTQVLRFIVPSGASGATADLEFTAGVRTLPGREILLSVDAVPPGSSGVTFAGEGEGIVPGRLTSRPTVLARWNGGGQRGGRVTFTLDGVAPGVYTMPVRVFLTVL